MASVWYSYACDLSLHVGRIATAIGPLKRSANINLWLVPCVPEGPRKILMF